MVDLELAVAPMHRLCKKAGAERVSEAAAEEMARALEINQETCSIEIRLIHTHFARISTGSLSRA